MFFRMPDDLRHMDMENGQCYNQGCVPCYSKASVAVLTLLWNIAQDSTFGYQGLPFRIGDEAPVNGSSGEQESEAVGTTGLGAKIFLVSVFVVFLVL